MFMLLLQIHFARWLERVADQWVHAVALQVFMITLHDKLIMAYLHASGEADCDHPHGRPQPWARGV